MDDDGGEDHTYDDHEGEVVADVEDEKEVHDRYQDHEGKNAKC